MSSRGVAQQPSVTIHDRVIADFGPYCDGSPSCPGLNEPALAMTRRKQVGASQAFGGHPSLDRPVRAVLGSNQSGSWTAQPLTSPAPTPSYGGIDVSVSVVDPSMDSFVVFGMNGRFTGTGKIRYRTWTPGSGFSDDWVDAYAASGDNVDKPWVIRRAANDFLVFWVGSGDYRYLRSNDGMNWRAADGGMLPWYAVVTDPQDEPVLAGFCCQPAIAADGRVFLAHVARAAGSSDPGIVRVLAGWDPEGDNAGPLVWEYLRDHEDGVVSVALRLPGSDQLPVTCPQGDITSRTVPLIACDPSHAGRAYIAFQDIAADDPSDVNVYLVRLVYSNTGGSSGWDESVSPLVPETTSIFGVRGDQFLPQIAVDSNGWVHVQYYDNRPAFVNVPDCTPGGWMGKYDAYYALSTNEGQSFTHHILRPNCEVEPALNLDLQGSGIDLAFTPREYNGMALYESGGRTRVWMLYTGTTDDPAENPHHRDVIYAQQVVVGSAN